MTDAAGATNTSVTQAVTVHRPRPNAPPAADFTFVCNAEECTFTDASTDSDGTIASYAWDFGDGNTSTEADPVHTYTGITELTDFDVTLTVTDDDGATDTGHQDRGRGPAGAERPATTAAGTRSSAA